jgi:DNA-binding NarL/FixJ family response regulator
MTPSIRVILADDHTILRQGLKFIISQHPAIRVVGEAANGLEALALMDRLTPDVLVCDISMPQMSGIELARQWQQQNGKTRIIFLTMQDKEEYIVQAIEAGVAGFLPKETAGEELVQAIAEVAQGREFFSPSIYPRVIKALRQNGQKSEIRITPREKEVLVLLADGLSTKLIASKLFVSEYTVSNHRANLLQKLSVHNTAELVKKAIELSLIP